ncbi:tautomerase family protein [Humitalea sp. 24SJ18S-53]|uniref:tautomerase family protein n=1 Tax=Humitalea sp. 24SJ18S-53 TaxID=3422307 RepID=UPI003D67F18E
MPIMDVRYPAGGLDQAAKADLAKRLTDVLIRMEGGAGTDGGRAFASVLFTAVPEGDWWVGGETGARFVHAPGRFLVHVTIPEGYMNAEHKGEVHRWVAAAILAATGTEEPGAGGSILTVIDEVTEGNWGAGGGVISLDSIAGSVGMSKTGARFDWVRAYFAAKARMLTAFGYPADIGGLPPSQPR